MNLLALPWVVAPYVVSRGWARRIVLALGARLQSGSLVIRDQSRGDIHRFGTEDTSLRAEIDVFDERFYSAVLQGGSVAAGEAFSKGWWSSPDLVQVVRLLARNREALNAMDDGPWARLQGWRDRWGHKLRGNTRAGSRKNIRAHYDLGNEFFGLFLDPTRMYSAALFRSPDDSLEQASINKLNRICDALELSPKDHLLEIGTGWGGMAVHAAKTRGCRVTTTTISDEQYQFAQDWVAREGLGDRVTVLKKDYRDLRGEYDKLVSIEMIEAVGHEHLREYFRVCNERLKPGGSFLLQAITIRDSYLDRANRSVDFIQKHIFPGGSLPSMSVIYKHVAVESDLYVADHMDMTDHYARTLRLWSEALRAARSQLPGKVPEPWEDFYRLWQFYFAYCEGGFLEKSIQAGQTLLKKRV